VSNNCEKKGVIGVLRKGSLRTSPKPDNLTRDSLKTPLITVTIIGLLVGIQCECLAASDGQPTTQVLESEITCGNAIIRAEVKYYREEIAGPPKTYIYRGLSKVLTFARHGLETRVALRTTEEDVTLGSSNWRCVRGKSEYYLILNFDTGGNCVACEWLRIYSLDGKIILDGGGTT